MRGNLKLFSNPHVSVTVILVSLEESNLSIENLKKQAAEGALENIENGQTIGLGTGTTVKYFIFGLAAKIREGLRVKVIPTSIETEILARKLGLDIIDINEAQAIDLTVDGADEIDDRGYMLKGGKAALAREKIVAFHSLKYFIVVDETKISDLIGKKRKVSVETLRYGWMKTKEYFDKSGFKAEVRKLNGENLVTDNGNYILDVDLGPIKDPEAKEKEINSIPGVIENGIFTIKPGKVYVGTWKGLKVRSFR